mmetsp:Transcript_60769/g.185573  ORF Transcript_60769/g.185573 Transcript_60769/m.185573 type:complete len:352 (+) Transcript_60769:800-1855(+)
MRPLFFCCARPMNVEWKMRPYFGVFPLVFNARKSAFSAPRICTVEAGYFARLVRLPACEMRRAPMISPIKEQRFGATRSIFAFKYSCKLLRIAANLITSFAKWSMFCMSMSTMSWPIDIFMALVTSSATSSEPHASAKGSISPSKLSRTRITRATLACAMLSVTILANSGKCHAYHSRTLIANVLIFLSKLSSNAMQLIIGLSCRFGSNCILLRLKAWPKPSRALSKSVSLNFLTSRLKCMRQPRNISRTLWPWVMENVAPSSLPSSGSYTPNWYFFFAFGRFISKKLISDSVGVPAEIALTCSSASSAFVKGDHACITTILPNFLTSAMDAWISSSVCAVSSYSFFKNRA